MVKLRFGANVVSQDTVTTSRFMLKFLAGYKRAFYYIYVSLTASAWFSFYTQALSSCRTLDPCSSVSCAC